MGPRGTTSPATRHVGSHQGMVLLPALLSCSHHIDIAASGKQEVSFAIGSRRQTRWLIWTSIGYHRGNYNMSKSRVGASGGSKPENHCPFQPRSEAKAPQREPFRSEIMLSDAKYGPKETLRAWSRINDGFRSREAVPWSPYPLRLASKSAPEHRTRWDNPRLG